MRVGSFVLCLVISSLVFVVTVSQVREWTDEPWFLDRNADDVPSLTDSNAFNHWYGRARAVLQNSGHFWLFWQRETNELFGQRFKLSDYSRVGPKIRLSDVNVSYAEPARAVHLNSTDGFAVAWYTSDSSIDGNGGASVLAIFHPNGTKVRDDIVATTETLYSQYLRDFTTIQNEDIPNGERIVITYSSSTSNYNTFMCMFEIDGTPVSDSVEVDPNAIVERNCGVVDELDQGRFVVSWAEIRSGSSNDNRRASIYDANGTRIVTKTLFSGMESSESSEFTILGLTKGFSMVLYQKEITDSIDLVTGALFDDNLTQCGNEFVIFNDTSLSQIDPLPSKLEVLPNGTVVFAASWRSQGSGTSYWVVYLQIYLFDPPPNGECSENNLPWKIGDRFLGYPQGPEELALAGRATRMNEDGTFILPVSAMGLLDGYSGSYTGVGAQIYRLINTALTDAPTMNTIAPTAYPTAQPTSQPTFHPTLFTHHPTQFPTNNPSMNPTIPPTANPTVSPTTIPTAFPTRYPSQSPSSNPTGSPSQYPSVHPTQEPSQHPTMIPTTQPSFSPSTLSPTSSTDHPSGSPTPKPTLSPTTDPTNSPSQYPSTSAPSLYPTLSPLNNPSTPPTSLERRSNNNAFNFMSPLFLIVAFGSVLIMCCMVIGILIIVLLLKRSVQFPETNLVLNMPSDVMNTDPTHAPVMNNGNQQQQQQQMKVHRQSQNPCLPEVNQLRPVKSESFDGARKKYVVNNEKFELQAQPRIEGNVEGGTIGGDNWDAMSEDSVNSQAQPTEGFLFTGKAIIHYSG